MAESEEELKSLLMKLKEESETWLNTQPSENLAHGIQTHHFMLNRWGNNGNRETLFSWAPESMWMVTVPMKLKDACSLEVNL